MSEHLPLTPLIDENSLNKTKRTAYARIMDSFVKEWGRIWSSSLARNTGWILLGQGLSIVFQGIYFVLLGRLLGSTEYGVYVGALAMVSIVSQYGPLGSGVVLLRYVSPDPKNFAPYWGNVLVTSFTLGTVLVGLITWIGPHLAHTYARTLLLYVALGECFCTQLTLSASRVFQAFEKMRITAALNLLVNMLRALLAGLMLWRLHHATARQWVLATLFISTVAAVTAVVVVTRSYGKPVFRANLLFRRTGEGFIFALSYSTDAIYYYLDKAMLGHYGMNAANGIYTMAYRVIDVACVPFGAIHTAAIPRFFQKGVSGAGNTAPYALRIIKRTLPIAALSTVFLLVAAPMIPHLTGKSFSESVSALRWLCLLPVLRSFQWSAGDALTGAGHQKLRLGSQAAATVFNFAVNLCLIPQYGWLGAAWTALATDALLATFNCMALLAVSSPAKDLAPS